MTSWVTYDQDFWSHGLFPFIVQNRDPVTGRIQVSGNSFCGVYTPAGINDILFQRRADFFHGVPQGQETIDCVLDASRSYAVQYESFTPGLYTSNGGNGGDLVGITSDGFIQAFATMDGGHPGELYYFRATGNSNGWLQGGIDAPLGGGWVEHTTSIINPFNPGEIDIAYTRYFRGMIPIPIFVNGNFLASITLECFLSEHYNSGVPGATGFERFICARGLGKIRWESWQLNGIQCDLNRVPDIHWAGPNSKGVTNENWVITDCRHWANFINDTHSSTFTVESTGWPPGVQLP